MPVPEAGRWIGPGSFRPIPGLCDYILINHDGRSAFVDTKSINDIRFPYSLIDRNQLKHMQSVGDLCPAGYVVYFRPAARVVFLTWKQLEMTGPRESIQFEHGLDLGPIGFFDAKKIFACKEIKI